MYGLIGRMIAHEGRRDELVAAMLGGLDAMPGCLSYVVSTDPTDANSVWVTEVWDSAASHQASLGIPAVQALIQRARPLIAGFGDRRELDVRGGHGLVTGSV